MSKPLPLKLDASLKTYQAYVDHFYSGSGDTFIALGERDFLQFHAGELTVGQQAWLDATDRKVLTLVAKDYGIDADDDDVRTLRMIADIINSQTPTVQKAA